MDFGPGLREFKIPIIAVWPWISFLTFFLCFHKMRMMAIPLLQGHCENHFSWCIPYAVWKLVSFPSSLRIRTLWTISTTGSFLNRRAILKNAALRSQIQTSCLRSPVMVSGNFDVSEGKKKVSRKLETLSAFQVNLKESKTHFQQVGKK